MEEMLNHMEIFQILHIKSLIFQFPAYLEIRGLVTWYIGYWEVGSKYKGN